MWLVASPLAASPWCSLERRLGLCAAVTVDAGESTLAFSSCVRAWINDITVPAPRPPLPRKRSVLLRLTVLIRRTTCSPNTAFSSSGLRRTIVIFWTAAHPASLCATRPSGHRPSRVERAALSAPADRSRRGLPAFFHHNCACPRPPGGSIRRTPAKNELLFHPLGGPV